MWIIIAGILGARLFHVLDHWHEYSIDPIRALYIWESGLAIWGALVGGLIAAAFVSWNYKWQLSRLLDAAAPGSRPTSKYWKGVVLHNYPLVRWFSNPGKAPMFNLQTS